MARSRRSARHGSAVTGDGPCPQVPAPADDAPPPVLPPGEWERAITAGLSRLRKRRGWSQRELARRSGLHQRTIWLLEQTDGAKPRPSQPTLTALARAFGYLHLSDFWGALQGPVVADPGTPLVVGVRMREMVQAFMDLTPRQQRLLEGVILIWSARQQAAALGEEATVDLDELAAG